MCEWLFSGKSPLGALQTLLRMESGPPAFKMKKGGKSKKPQAQRPSSTRLGTMVDPLTKV